MGLVYQRWVLEQGIPPLAAGATPCLQSGSSIYREEMKKFKGEEETTGGEEEEGDSESLVETDM